LDSEGVWDEAVVGSFIEQAPDGHQALGNAAGAYAGFN
jgi:hypothetical protein